jgi:hypothetical protein
LFEIVKLIGREPANGSCTRDLLVPLNTAAKLETVWVERKYCKAKEAREGCLVEIAHIWHLTTAYAETSRDYSCKEGAPVWGGRRERAHRIVVDDGIGEIHDTCRALNPADAARGTTGICGVM